MKSKILGFLKFIVGYLYIIPLLITLLSGVFGLINFVILLYSNDTSQSYQQALFGRIAFIALVISSVWLWIREHLKVILLEKKIANLESQLVINIEDIYLTGVFANKEFSNYITLDLNVVNHKKEDNAIKNIKFTLIEAEENTEFPTQDYIYLRSGFDGQETRNRWSFNKSKGGKSIIFSQGHPTHFYATFHIPLNSVIFKDINLDNKDYELEIIDSYDKPYLIREKIPKDFVKLGKSCLESDFAPVQWL